MGQKPRTSAYKRPKLDLNSIMGTIDNTLCKTYAACKNHTRQRYFEKKRITLNNWAIESAITQHMYMNNVLIDWRKSSSNSVIMDAPFIFDSNIATPSKSSAFIIFDWQLNLFSRQKT